MKGVVLLQGCGSDLTGEGFTTAHRQWTYLLGCPGQSWSPVSGKAGCNPSECRGIVASGQRRRRRPGATGGMGPGGLDVCIGRTTGDKHMRKAGEQGAGVPVHWEAQSAPYPLGRAVGL